MQSGQTSQSTTTPSPSAIVTSSTSADVNTPKAPRANVHKKLDLQPGESPMDFITKNLAASEAPPANLNPEAVSEAVRQSRETENQEPQTNGVKEEGTKVTAKDPLPDVFPEAPKEDKPAATETSPEEVDEPAPGSVEENYKLLRKTYKEIKKEKLELENKAKTLNDELEKFKTGQALPEVLQKQEEKIQKLSKYQKLYDLESSEEYQEAFIKPLSDVQEKLKNIAASYNLPEGTIEKAIETNNVRDLNQFISEYFDPTGGLEFKALIDKAKGIKTQAFEAKKEPGKALEALQAEGKRAAEVRDAQRKSVIAATARDTWTEALLEIRQQGKAQELIYKDNDPEHNDTYVTPILSQAAKEYGRVVRELADLGAKELPKELGKAIANYVLLAHASVTALETRTRAVSDLENIQRNVERESHYVRPPIGGGTPRSPQAPTHDTKRTLQQDAQSLIQSTLAGKR